MQIKDTQKINGTPGWTTPSFVKDNVVIRNIPGLL